MPDTDPHSDPNCTVVDGSTAVGPGEALAAAAVVGIAGIVALCRYIDKHRTAVGVDPLLASSAAQLVPAAFPAADYPFRAQQSLLIAGRVVAFVVVAVVHIAVVHGVVAVACIVVAIVAGIQAEVMPFVVAMAHFLWAAFAHNKWSFAAAHPQQCSLH